MNLKFPKCPRCKSTEVIFRSDIYAMSPNVCTECGLKWEATFFSRIFLILWIVGLFVLVSLPAPSWLHMLGPHKKHFLMIGLATYIGALFVIPLIAHLIEPYKEWSGSERERAIVNLGAKTLLWGGCALFLYSAADWEEIFRGLF